MAYLPLEQSLVSRKQHGLRRASFLYREKALPTEIALKYRFDEVNNVERFIITINTNIVQSAG
jgi:hypothetical protein